MEIRDYIAVLSRHRWIVLGTVLATVATTAAASRLIAREYEASVTLRTAPGTALVGGNLRADDVTYLERLQNTYGKLATSEPLVNRLMSGLGLKKRPHISVGGVPNTELMKLRVRDRRPAVAAAAADRLATLLIASVQASADESARTADRLFTRRNESLEAQIAKNQREFQRLRSSGSVAATTQLKMAQLKRTINLEFESLAELRKDYEQYVLARQARASGLSVIEKAAVPTHPVSPNDKLLLPLAFVLGLAGGLGLAFLIENLSARLYSKEEVEKATEAPVVGSIPAVRRDRGKPFFNGGSPAEEAFRRLRTTFLSRGNDRDLQTVLVTSAVRGEGKSAVVANFGRVIAQSGRRVLVVDADLRLPSLSKAMGAQDAVGLTDVLRGMAPGAAIRPLDGTSLFVLPAGRSTANPVEVLASEDMRELIGELERSFDVLLIDSPALLAVSDPLVLVPHVQSVLFVVSYGRARREDVRSASEQLMQMNPRSVSILVNRSKDETRYGYGYGYSAVSRNGRQR